MTGKTLIKILFWVGLIFIIVGVIPSLAEMYRYLGIIQREFTQVFLIIFGLISFGIAIY